MIEKHQILIDGLVKIVQTKTIKADNTEDFNRRSILRELHYKTIASDTLKTYMGANNLESDERSFLPGYHDYITAHVYDAKHGYLNIEYTIPLSVWPKNQTVILNKRYNKTHMITQLNWSHTHLTVLIEMI